MEPPGKQGLLKEWGGLLAGAAGVLTAAGALLKSCDHSVTQSAYVTLSGSIAKLSDQEQRDHADLASLRGYLDGMARRAPQEAPAADEAGKPAGAPQGRRPPPRAPRPEPPPAPPAETSMPVPTVSPPPPPVRAPDFDTIK